MMILDGQQQGGYGGGDQGGYGGQSQGGYGGQQQQGGYSSGGPCTFFLTSDIIWFVADP
jgi:hypothetical protein